MHEVVIVSLARTPIGSFGGKLASLTAIELGKTAMQAAMQRAGIDYNAVNEIYMGNVLQANVGQAPARQAALAAGFNPSVVCTTINKVCASGMKSVMLAAQSIRLGDAEVVLAGGMESMSQAPFLLTRQRWGNKYGNIETVDCIVRDALQDPYNGNMMGNVGELCANTYGFSRQDQDDFSIESYKRAETAYKNGWFNNEICPVTIPNPKGEPTVITEDEEYRNVRYDKVASLKPAFDKNGTITAFNASKINDGAAALVLMSRAKADELGLKPIARIVSYADAEQDPDWFTTAPSKAAPLALKRANLTIDQIDACEINEAFAVVALSNMRLLGVPHEKTNRFGGAVALGHPVGASGARIICTLISSLQQCNGRYGLAAICNGGGGASAIVIERM